MNISSISVILIIFRNCLILLSLLWIISSTCLVIYSESVNSLIVVQLAMIKIKNHISVVLYSIFLLLHPKDTFNRSIATFYCLMELMDIWNSSSEITILFHFRSVKLLFIRKSIMNWPDHKRDIIGSHCQNVQREGHVWSRVLTVPSRFHFHFHLFSSTFSVLAAFSASPVRGADGCRSSSLNHFWCTFNRKRKKYLFLKVLHNRKNLSIRLLLNQSLCLRVFSKLIYWPGSNDLVLELELGLYVPRLGCHYQKGEKDAGQT